MVQQKEALGLGQQQKKPKNVRISTGAREKETLGWATTSIRLPSIVQPTIKLPTKYQRTKSRWRLTEVVERKGEGLSIRIIGLTSIKYAKVCILNSKIQFNLITKIFIRFLIVGAIVFNSLIRSASKFFSPPASPTVQALSVIELSSSKTLTAATATTSTTT